MNDKKYDMVESVSDIKLTKEQRKEIRDCVFRFLRMKRKRIIRKAGTIILYPITKVRKQKISNVI